AKYSRRTETCKGVFAEDFLANRRNPADQAFALISEDCVLATRNAAWVGRDLKNRSDALPLPTVNDFVPSGRSRLYRILFGRQVAELPRILSRLQKFAAIGSTRLFC